MEGCERPEGAREKEELGEHQTIEWDLLQLRKDAGMYRVAAPSAAERSEQRRRAIDCSE